jgi:hypothetical protein
MTLNKSPTRLMIKVPSHLSSHHKETITIMAVNADGQIDKTRNDEIELKLEPLYITDRCNVKLDSQVMRLENGQATVGVLSGESDFVKLTASCKDEKAGLTPYSVLMPTGGFPFHSG